MKKRVLVIGDIHGNHKGLLQCLERSKFDNKTDTLISLGDVVDGHCESFEVVEELIKIKNLIAIKGNHDDWFQEWIETGINPSNWQQGQRATGESYLKHSRPEQPWMISDLDFFGFEPSIRTNDIPDAHIDFFKNQRFHYKDEKNRFFVHGGFNRDLFIAEQIPSDFWWDRSLWQKALSFGQYSEIAEDPPKKFRMVENFSEVFIGHTTTEFWGKTEPMHAANIWNLDTGGGMFGKISIMDVDTKEYWQSDKGSELYPGYKGRS